MQVVKQEKLDQDRSSSPQGEVLAGIVARWIKNDGDIETLIPGLSFFRRETPRPPCSCLVEPSIVLAVQGEKQMLIGDQSYRYNARYFLINSLDLPA